MSTQPLLPGLHNANDAGAVTTAKQTSSSLLLKSLATSSVTLGASLLGTGILSQARAVSQIGIVFFVVLSLVFISLSHLTGLFLIRTSSAIDQQDYRNVVGAILGWKGKVLTSVCIILQQIGACTGYVVVVGDVFTPLVERWGHKEHVEEWVVRVVLMVVIVSPLAFARELTGLLKYTSAASVCAIVTLAITIFCNGIYVLNNSERREELIRPADKVVDGSVNWLPHGVGSFRAIPIICFAYFVHFNVLPVYYSIPLSLKRAEVYTAASVRAFLIAGVATMLAGVFGYLTFLKYIESDILNNFKVSGTYVSSLMNVIRAIYGLGLLFAFPVILYEARSNVFGLLNFYATRDVTAPLLTSSEGGEDVAASSSTTTNNNKEEPFQVPTVTFVSCTLLLLGITTTLGCLVKDLSTVFGLVGSTVTPFLTFVLPCWTYLQSEAYKLHGNDATVAKGVLILGVALIPFGFIIWLLDMIGTFD